MKSTDKTSTAKSSPDASRSSGLTRSQSQHATHKPRKRTYLACTFCRARKQRCDAKQPRCSNCKSQDTECIYQAASKRSWVTQQYVQSLLNQIEGLHAQLDGTAVTSTSPPLGGDPGSVLSASTDEHGLIPPFDNQVALVDIPSQPATSPAVTHEADQACKDSVSCSGESRNGTVGSNQHVLADNVFQEPSDINGVPTASLANDGTQGMLIAESSSRSNDTALSRPAKQYLGFDLHTLPQRWLANYLVDCYMEFCHPQYPFLHAGTFRRQYAQMWISSEPPDAVLAGTVNAVFALGCHFSPGTSAAQADSYFQRANALILSEHEPKNEAIADHLQALALLSMYPQGPEHQEDVWDIIGMMIRLLPMLDVSGRAAYQNFEETVRAEMNVRLFWAAFVLDAVHSSYWGREPRFPSSNFSQVNLPQALEVEDGPMDDHNHENTSNAPPQISFFVQTIRLCQLMRTVAMTYRSLPRVAQSLEIDQQILTWFSSIPYFSLGEQVDQSHDRVWRQREVLTSRFLHLRVFLLTRHLKSSPSPPQQITAYTSVKEVADTALQPILEEACVKAAIELLHHLEKLYTAKDGPHSAWWYDLKKIMASSTALLLHLNKLAEEGLFVVPTPPTTYQAQDRALQVALQLLQHIEDSGKMQAAEIRRRLETDYRAVKDKLRALDCAATTAAAAAAEAQISSSQAPPPRDEQLPPAPPSAAVTAQATAVSTEHQQPQPLQTAALLGELQPNDPNFDALVGYGSTMEAMLPAGATGYEPWDSAWDTVEPFWLDLLH